MRPPEIKLVETGIHGMDEDWYIHVDGVSCGYLYRVAGGYAVGIEGDDGNIAHNSIEPDVDAAVAFAKRHFGVPHPSIAK